MRTCSRGHQSQADDYCDECGAPITAGSALLAAATSAPDPGPANPCPECGTTQAGRFCEVCGYDFVLARLATGPSAALAASDPRGAATGVWRLVATADGAFHASTRAEVDANAEPIPLPPFVPERRFDLAGDKVLIGRRSRSRGIEPEIDLSGPPVDPAVSHAHALLIAQPDGSWSLVDLQSSNGTYLNDSEAPLGPNTPTPLRDGDVIHIGAWTALTLQAG